MEDDSKVLKQSLVDLALYGCQNVSVIAQSVLANSLQREDMKATLAEAEPEPEQVIENGNLVPKSRFRVGKVKFSSLRKTYKILRNGGKVPHHSYAFRVDPEKISQLIAFLQNSLQVKPGILRDINVAGHLFNSMPVYERGGKTVEQLFNAYKESFPERAERVGQPTFEDILKLVTKRGETKAGLSTYYIQLRNGSKTFQQMLSRLKTMDPFIDKAVVTEQVEELEKQWSEIQQFVMWSYSHKHVVLSDRDITHCCTYALGGNCPHEHFELSCCQCTRLLQFFEVTIAPFLHSILTPDITDPECRAELQNMKATVPYMSNLMVQYTSHRLRAKVQFQEIEHLKTVWLRADPTRKLIVLDHKQKVLGMKYREGQLEYFGKKGMSLLGTMEVQWNEVAEGNSGLQYSFVDYVVKGYSAQDHVQIAAVIEKVLLILQDHNPDTKEVCFQSDNASCFTSQDLIPYIYHMNLYGNYAWIVNWIFTEAQTGRGRLDTHFSYVNQVLKSYVEDGNDIDLEEDVFKALSYHGGIAGTRVVLVDGSELEGPINSKTFRAKTGCHETHEIKFHEQRVEILKSSGISKPEVVRGETLLQYQPHDLTFHLGGQFTSPKAPLFVRMKAANNAQGEQQPTVANSKANAYEMAVLEAGVQPPQIEPAPYIERGPLPQEFHQGWAAYPGKNIAVNQSLSREVMLKLHDLFMLGNNQRKRKVSAERALRILEEEMIATDWVQRFIVTVPKIKAFFQLSPAQQLSMIERHTPNEDEGEYQQLVEVVENNDAQQEHEDSAESLLD